MNEIQRLLAIRDGAFARGDIALGREAQIQIWRLGYTELETAVTPVETAVKRKPGRPRKAG